MTIIRRANPFDELTLRRATAGTSGMTGTAG
jgi:hypothetical protein